VTMNHWSSGALAPWRPELEHSGINALMSVRARNLRACARKRRVRFAHNRCRWALSLRFLLFFRKNAVFGSPAQRAGGNSCQARRMARSKVSIGPKTLTTDSKSSRRRECVVRKTVNAEGRTYQAHRDGGGIRFRAHPAMAALLSRQSAGQAKPPMPATRIPQCMGFLSARNPDLGRPRWECGCRSGTDSAGVLAR
jgi:hypothetical protein